MALYKHKKYDIKRKYYRILQIGLILSLSLLILAFKFFPDVEKIKFNSNPLQDVLVGVEIPITNHKKLPPPPPTPPIPIEAPTDELLDDFEMAPTDIVFKIPDLPPPPPPKNEDEDNIATIFVVVEQMPEPIGGIGAIQKQIIYPEFAIRAGIQGKVFVKAYVDENGKIFKVELAKGIGGGCDEVAMKAVKNSMFSPGMQRGKPVKVQVTIPILFKLQ